MLQRPDSEFVNVKAGNSLTVSSMSSAGYVKNTTAGLLSGGNTVSLTADVTGTLPVTGGGTGIATVAQGDLLYGSASNTISALAKNATPKRYLSNTGTSNNPAWAQVDVALGVTGILGASNGGTGSSSYTDGDLLAGSGGGLTPITASTAGKFLRAAGTSTLPTWSTTVWPNSSATGDLVYSNITNNYTNLALGASNTVLTSNGLTPAWSSALTLTGLTLNGKEVQTVSLVAATGDEYALDLAYTTNKASSGDDYGIRITQTDTASPGTSYFVRGFVGATPKFYVDNVGSARFANEVLVGTDSDTLTVGGVTIGSQFKADAEGFNDLAQLLLQRHSDTNLAPAIVFSRSRGDIATKTIVQDNSIVMNLLGVGYDGTDYERAAAILFEVDGTPGAGDMPGRIVMQTTPDGSGTLSERLRINSSGQFTTTSQLLAATGDETALTLNYTTNKLTSGDDYGIRVVQTDTASPGTSYLMSLETAAAKFFTVLNTGVVTAYNHILPSATTSYDLGSSSARFSVVWGRTFNTGTGFTSIRGGSAAIPDLDCTGTTDTSTSGSRNRIYEDNAFAPTSGTAEFRGYTIEHTINQTGGASGITRGIYINPTLTAAADYRAIEVANGQVLLPLKNDAAKPTLAFGDGDTGFYESSDDVLILSTAGAARSYVYSSEWVFGVNTNYSAIKFELPTSTNPNFCPTGSDDDTGIGWAAANQLSLIAGGVEGQRITKNATSTLHTLNGTLAADTGEESAVTIPYTTNKASSGDDIGLKIIQTDTASPGTSYGLWVGTTAGFQFRVSQAGGVIEAGGLTTGGAITAGYLQSGPFDVSMNGNGANTGLALASDNPITWSSDTNYYGTRDLGLKRAAAGVMQVTDSSTGKGWIVKIGDTSVASQFDKTTDVALGTVTGLSATVLASRKYRFRAVLFVDADVVGGSKFAIGGTATATAVIYEIKLLDDSTNAYTITARQTALGGSTGQASTTAGLCEIIGTITVNAGGTLVVQFAQNASNGTSSVLVGSTFSVQDIT
jgi:hypothetical protein